MPVFDTHCVQLHPLGVVVGYGEPSFNCIYDKLTIQIYSMLCISNLPYTFTTERRLPLAHKGEETPLYTSITHLSHLATFPFPCPMALLMYGHPRGSLSLWTSFVSWM